MGPAGREKDSLVPILSWCLVAHRHPDLLQVGGSGWWESLSHCFHFSRDGEGWCAWDKLGAWGGWIWEVEGWLSCTQGAAWAGHRAVTWVSVQWGLPLSLVTTGCQSRGKGYGVREARGGENTPTLTISLSFYNELLTTVSSSRLHSHKVNNQSSQLPASCPLPR